MFMQMPTKRKASLFMPMPRELKAQFPNIPADTGCSLEASSASDPPNEGEATIPENPDEEKLSYRRHSATFSYIRSINHFGSSDFLHALPGNN